jgi:15-cis-phytoene synthase
MTGVADPPPALLEAPRSAAVQPGPGLTAAPWSGIWSLEPLCAPRDLAHADALCRRLVRRHPENFTAISPLVPASVRAHLARVYAFCRVTDDLGDETGAAAPVALSDWRDEVEGVLLRSAPPRTALTLALGVTVRVRALPAAPFLDLVAANVQDQLVRDYASWPELLAYCRLSATPVGRMVLGVVGVRDRRAQRLSDDVCVGLQLANFAQDVAVDAAKGRTYLVGEDIRDHGPVGAIRVMCDRAEWLLGSGEELESLCSGWLRAQLALYRLGGLAVVAAVRARGCDTRQARPGLRAGARARVAVTALPALFRPAAVDTELRDAARVCRDRARREAANFYWGFVALPRPQREAIHAVYVFARRVDDVADGPGAGSPRVRLDAERRHLRAAMSGGVVDDPVLRMLAVAIPRHAIPIGELEAIVDGVERDAGRVRYATWDELAGYCRLVASSVGRICVRIFGFSDPRALERADELGIAMQLTNILRDVREDASLGRLYLPAEDLERAGVDGDALLALPSAGAPRVDPAAWAALVRAEAERARSLFESGLQVCGFVPYRAATCVRTMAGIYRTLLADIEADPAQVLEARVSLGGRRKLGVLARSLVPVTVERNGAHTWRP